MLSSLFFDLLLFDEKSVVRAPNARWCSARSTDFVFFPSKRSVHLQTLISTVILTMEQNSSTVRHRRRQNNKLRKNTVSNNDLTRNNQRYKTLSNSYEKSTFTYLGQRHLKNGAKNSPVQTKARAVIRKYKLQLRQLEFKRLQKILPTMQNSDSTNDSDEVSTKIIYITYLNQT